MERKEKGCGLYTLEKQSALRVLPNRSDVGHVFVDYMIMVQIPGHGGRSSVRRTALGFSIHSTYFAISRLKNRRRVMSPHGKLDILAAHHYNAPSFP